MCDDAAFDDMIEHNLRQGGISRRELGSLALGAGIAFALPRVANAMDTVESEVEIATPDGQADAYFVHPATGKHAAVLVWPDIFGLRPAFRQMGKRLAESGYAVLVLNPFYRTRKAPTSPEKANFDDPETRKQLMALRGTLSPATARTDAQAFTGWLDAQAAVDTNRGVGTTGYCMGGPLVFETAAVVPVLAAANVRAGGSTPLASVVHALFLVAAILVLAPLLAWIPMASMAALLLVVAWSMSEARHFVRIIRIAPRDDVATLLTCFTLTVVFNMEIAVAVGIGLAAMLFIRRSIELTGARLIERHTHAHGEPLPANVMLYDIDGPLFFGAAQKALSEIATLRREVRVVILDMTDVTMLDMTALVALESITESLRKQHVALIINNLQPRMRVKLRRAGIRKQRGRVEFTRNLHEAATLARARAANNQTPV